MAFFITVLRVDIELFESGAQNEESLQKHTTFFLANSGGVGGRSNPLFFWLSIYSKKLLHVKFQIIAHSKSIKKYLYLICTMKDCCLNWVKGEGGLSYIELMTGCRPDTRPYCKCQISHMLTKNTETQKGGMGNRLLLCFCGWRLP